MSEHGSLPDPEPLDWRAFWLWMVRYGLGIVIVIIGFAILLVAPEVSPEISGMTIGAGVTAILVGWIIRMGNRGDVERDAEERARAYYDEHGRWPDDD